MWDKIFDLDNPFYRVMSRLADIFILNLVFVLTCIPIITIGDAITSLFYASYTSIENDGGYIVKRYFKSFFSNFKQSTIIWLIMLVVGFVLAVDDYFWIYNWVENRVSYAPPFILISVVLSFVYGMIFMYVFALQAKFENPIKATFKNAFVLSIRHFPVTMSVVIVLLVIMTVVLMFHPISSAVMLFYGIGLTGFIVSALIRPVINKYIPKKEHVDRTEQLNLASEMMELAQETLAHMPDDDSDNNSDNDDASDNE